MKILFVTPSMTVPHGGFRVIHEVAWRMVAFDHDVTLHSLAKDRDACTWYDFPPELKFQTEYDPKGFDILVICSPHSLHLAERADAPPRVVLWCQGAEHMLQAKKEWQELCGRFYASRYPLLAISSWNIAEIRKFKSPASPIYSLGNGVNFDHFPIDNSPKDGKTIFVEGWEATHPVKDPMAIGPKVALRLKSEGYHILAYCARPLVTFPKVPHEYFYRPSLKVMNDLYRRATILLKASKYDARACAPVEAMTKGTVTARAIIMGDDDLVPQNSLRTPYEENALYHVAKKLLTDIPLREKLSRNCLDYVQKYSWDYYMPLYNAAILGENEQPHQTVIVSVVYKEPDWVKTKACIEASGVPVVYVERQPPGVGSLSEAANRGILEALQKHPQCEYLWLVTNVTFERDTLTRLQSTLRANPGFGMVHPIFASGHLFCQRIPSLSGIQSVPFVELTAPLLRRDMVEAVGLFDDTMPYWGQDIDYGMRARAGGFLVGVDQETSVGHVYVHQAVHSAPHDVTRRRLALRKAHDNSTRARLAHKYGPGWEAATGRYHKPGEAF